MNTSTHQNAQMMQFAFVMFGSIIAAVILSTVIIMSLMRGELASALSSNVTTTQNGASCVDPTAVVSAAETPVDSSAVVAAGNTALMPEKVVNSFNTTNTSTTTTTNYEYNDSFNTDSYNDSHDKTWNINKNNGNTKTIIKDNVVIVDSGNGNAFQSGNTSVVAPVTTTTTTTNTAIDNSLTSVNSGNLNSGNTDSGNVVTTTNTAVVTENHVLSDNIIVAPITVPVLPII